MVLFAYLQSQPGAQGQQQYRRGSLQLWQFLVALLHDPANSSCIAWTGRGMEFKLVEPEEVIFFIYLGKKRSIYQVHYTIQGVHEVPLQLMPYYPM